MACLCAGPKPREDDSNDTGLGESTTPTTRGTGVYDPTSWKDIVVEKHPLYVASRGKPKKDGKSVKPYVLPSSRLHVSESYPPEHPIHEAYLVWRKILDDRAVKGIDHFDYWHHLRFIEARTTKTTFEFDKAYEYLSEHLAWVKSFKPDQITREVALKGLDTGKIVLHKRDKAGRPVMILYLRKHDFHKHNLTDSMKAIAYFMMFARQHVVQYGKDSYTCIMDASHVKFTQVKMGDCKQMVGIMQANFPSTLSQFFIVKAPKVLTYAWSMVKPFIEADTLEKIHITTGEANMKQTLLKYIDEDSLMTEFGGKSVYEMKTPYSMTETYPELHGKVPEPMKEPVGQIDFYKNSPPAPGEEKKAKPEDKKSVASSTSKRNKNKK